MKLKWIKTERVGSIDNQVISECYCENCKGLSYFRTCDGVVVGGKYCTHCGVHIVEFISIIQQEVNNET